MDHLPEVAEKSQAAKPWTLHVPLPFFGCPLGDREKIVFQLLDMFARNDPFCFVSYATLGKHANKTDRSIRSIVSQLEKNGFVKTVYASSKNSARVGIVMRERVNPDENPAARTPGEIALVERILLNRIPRAGSEGIFRPSKCMKTSSTDLDRRILLGAGSYYQPSEEEIRVGRKKRAFEIAKELPGVPKWAAKPLIDEFAFHCIGVLEDTEPLEDGKDSRINFKWHCKIGWALRREKLRSADQQRCLEDALHGGAVTGVENMAAHYNKAVCGLLGIEFDNSDFAELLSNPEFYASDDEPF